MTVRFRQERVGDWLGLRLENDELSILLLPEKGSDLLELRDRQRDLNLLWRAPGGLRPAGPAVTSLSNAAWLERYAGGWQELFPNAGDAASYGKATLGFHGEASVAPWTWHMGEDGNSEPSVRLDLRCRSMPFRLEKHVSLAPDRPLMRLRERVTNEGAAALPFMWGHHPAYGAPFLATGCRLDLPAREFEADADQDAERATILSGTRSNWPVVVGKSDEVDLRHIPGPEARIANLGYALNLTAGWYALRNPRLGLGIGLVWPLEVFPCVWLWQEFRGSAGHPWNGTTYVMGVEPHSSYPGHGLQRALERGTARWLQPGEHLEADLTAVLFAERGPVRAIGADGEVELA